MVKFVVLNITVIVAVLNLPIKKLYISFTKRCSDTQPM